MAVFFCLLMGLSLSLTWVLLLLCPFGFVAQCRQVWCLPSTTRSICIAFFLVFQLDWCWMSRGFSGSMFSLLMWLFWVTLVEPIWVLLWSSCWWIFCSVVCSNHADTFFHDTGWCQISVSSCTRYFLSYSCIWFICHL